jgi:hypothetical protein
VIVFFILNFCEFKWNSKTMCGSKLLLLQLTDISDDGYLCLMADNGDLREDLKVPDGELGAQLRTDFEAGKELLVSCMG